MLLQDCRHAPVNDCHFSVAARVSNDGETRDLGACPCRSIDADLQEGVNCLSHRCSAVMSLCGAAITRHILILTAVCPVKLTCLPEDTLLCAFYHTPS